MSEPNLSTFIGPVEDLLRGGDPQSGYGKVLLTLTVERPERDEEGRPVLGTKGKGKGKGSGSHPEHPARTEVLEATATHRLGCQTGSAHARQRGRPARGPLHQTLPPVRDAMGDGSLSAQDKRYTPLKCVTDRTLSRIGGLSQ